MAMTILCWVQRGRLNLRVCLPTPAWNLELSDAGTRNTMLLYNCIVYTQFIAVLEQFEKTDLYDTFITTVNDTAINSYFRLPQPIAPHHLRKIEALRPVEHRYFIASLYAATPAITRINAYMRGIYAGIIFALIVCASDGYLTLKHTRRGRGSRRFFRIARQLPMELQEELARRVVRYRGPINIAAFDVVLPMLLWQN